MIRRGSQLIILLPKNTEEGMRKIGKRRRNNGEGKEVKVEGKGYRGNRGRERSSKNRGERRESREMGRWIKLK